LSIKKRKEKEAAITEVDAQYNSETHRQMQLIVAG
jgi:hypothetical protein